MTLTTDVNTYPCGCKFRKDSRGHYEHFVHPACPFDNRYHAPREDYVYRHWSDLPSDKANR